MEPQSLTSRHPRRGSSSCRRVQEAVSNGRSVRRSSEREKSRAKSKLGAKSGL